MASAHLAFEVVQSSNGIHGPIHPNKNNNKPPPVLKAMPAGECASSNRYAIDGIDMCIGDECQAESLAPYFNASGTERCCEIEAINWDMMSAFFQACQANVPRAKDKIDIPQSLLVMTIPIY
ncbi:MAG: hypothetical protein ABIP82_06820 [Nitrospirales bacterium]